MDEAALSSYVAARRAALFRTACLLCGDPHRAEDIVQGALARLYGAWDRVSRMDNVDGYVRRIIVNDVIARVFRVAFQPLIFPVGLLLFGRRSRTVR